MGIFLLFSNSRKPVICVNLEDKPEFFAREESNRILINLSFRDLVFFNPLPKFAYSINHLLSQIEDASNFQDCSDRYL